MRNRAEIVQRWETEAGLNAIVMRVGYRPNPIMDAGGLFDTHGGGAGFWFNGYIAIPEGHLLYGKRYDDALPELNAAWEKAKQGDISTRGVLPLLCHSLAEASGESRGVTMDVLYDVHGSVTFAGKFDDELAMQNDLDPSIWWVGFDTAHSGDDPWKCDEAYVRNECERLAEQIVESIPT